MSKTIDLGVEKDHIESLTRASGISAISELIWNSLDSDSTVINIEYQKNTLGGFENIEISDNGRGIDYKKAQEVFGRLGGSEKKACSISPNGRQYHGKEGKGRYKALALGDLVTFTSIYKNSNSLKEFSITFDKNHLTHSEFSDLKSLPKGNIQTGFKVLIQNIDQENANQALDIKTRKELEQKFTSYYLSYPDFAIFVNGNKLEFESLIKNKAETEFLLEKNNLSYKFQVKLIEWKFDIKKKTYLCNTKGIPFRELNLGIRSTIPISIFVQSIYIENLQRENKMNLVEYDENLQAALTEAKKFAKEYIRKRLHYYSTEFIDKLKSRGIYPYKEKAENFNNELGEDVDLFWVELAKQCALIAVNEIITSNPHSNPLNTNVESTMSYWQEVKQEIQKL